MNQHIVVGAKSQIGSDLKTFRLNGCHIVDDTGYAEGDFCDTVLQDFALHACFQELDPGLLGDLINEYFLTLVELFDIEF